MSNLSKKRVKVEAATPLEEMDKSELINIVKKQRKSIKELETKLAGKGFLVFNFFNKLLSFDISYEI